MRRVVRFRRRRFCRRPVHVHTRVTADDGVRTKRRRRLIVAAFDLQKWRQRPRPPAGTDPPQSPDHIRCTAWIGRVGCARIEARGRSAQFLVTDDSSKTEPHVCPPWLQMATASGYPEGSPPAPRRRLARKPPPSPPLSLCPPRRRRQPAQQRQQPAEAAGGSATGIVVAEEGSTEEEFEWMSAAAAASSPAGGPVGTAVRTRACEACRKAKSRCLGAWPCGAFVCGLWSNVCVCVGVWLD